MGGQAQPPDVRIPVQLRQPSQQQRDVVRFVVGGDHEAHPRPGSACPGSASPAVLAPAVLVPAVLAPAVLVPAVLVPAVLVPAVLVRQCLSRQCLSRQCLPRNCPGAKQSSVSVPRSMSISFALRSRRRPVCEADPRIRGRRGGVRIELVHGPPLPNRDQDRAWSSHSRTGARHSTLNPPPARREPPHEPLPPPAPSLPHRGAYPVHQLHNSLTPVERARKVAAVWR